jgi:tyrosyl-tRNA synthetase
MPEVQAILRAIAAKELHPREAKRKLARTITTELHSAAAADEAEREFDRVHKDHEVPGDAPVVNVSVDGAKQIAIVDLLVQAGLEPSKARARKLVEQNGVHVNGELASLETSVPVSGELLLRAGKRRFRRVRFR